MSARNAESWVARAASRDLTRPARCVTWREPLKRRAFATDGHRVHVAPGDYPAGDPTFIAPRGRSFANVDPSIMQPATIDNVLGTTRAGVGIDGQALLRAVNAAAVADPSVKPSDRAVVLTSRDGHVEVYAVENHAHTLKIGRKVETLIRRTRGALVARVPGAPAPPYSPDIGFQARYLLDALAGAREMRIALVSPHDPLRIDHADGRIALVMPMRIDEVKP